MNSTDEAARAARLDTETLLDTPPGAGTPVEQALWLALDAGDTRSALSLCAREFGNDLNRFCMASVGTGAEAEQLVQETLLVALGNFGTLRRGASLRGWLFAIARRRCARAQLQRGPRRQRSAFAAPPPPASSGDEGRLRQQRASEAREILSALRPSDREAILLRYGNELSYRELGEAFEMAQSTVRQRVSHALLRLHRLLLEREVDRA